MDMYFEKNKKELLEQLSTLRSKNGPPAPAKTDADAAVDVALYGAASPFIDTVIVDLGKQRSIASFHDIEAAVAYCFEHSVRSIIVDMDPPTDWKMSTDLFTTVKTVKPDVQFILLTIRPRSIPVETLAAQKAIVLEKPFTMAALLRLIKLA